MKMLVSTLSLALILAFNISAFAGVVTMAQNQADCENTSGTWDARAKLCSEKRSNQACPVRFGSNAELNATNGMSANARRGHQLAVFAQHSLRKRLTRLTFMGGSVASTSPEADVARRQVARLSNRP
jgi:hypothetical protein